MRENRSDPGYRAEADAGAYEVRCLAAGLGDGEYGEFRVVRGMVLNRWGSDVARADGMLLAAAQRLAELRHDPMPRASGDEDRCGDDSLRTAVLLVLGDLRDEAIDRGIGSWLPR